MYVHNNGVIYEILNNPEVEVEMESNTTRTVFVKQEFTENVY